MITEKDLSIILQTAAKSSAELYHGTGNLEGMLEGMSQITIKIMRGMEALKDNVVQGPVTQEQATANVNAAFPGTTEVTAGFRNDDERWAHLFNHFDQWYDNRGDGTTTISGGTRPDFRLRANTDEKLFLVSKRYNKTAPTWVFERLGIPVPNLQPAPVAPATGQYQTPPPPAPVAPGAGNLTPF